MKRLSLIPILGIALFAMLFTSCVEDPGGGGGGGIFDIPPTLTIVDEAGFVSVDSEVSPSSNFSVKITVEKGDAALRSFTLQEDFLNVESSRFTVNGDASGANPKLLFSPDTDGFTWEITILSQDGVDSRNYNFIVEDENGETASSSINISTESSAVAPTVEFSGSGTFSADPGMLHSLSMTVGAGSFDLASIAVYENDVLMDASRLTFDDVAFDDNPFTLPAEDKQGFAKPILIRASMDAGVMDYRVVVTDEFGTSTAVTFTIETGIAGTPVTTLEGVLFNRAGPAGTGGLDLDSGDGTGSSDSEAEIRDEGIDISQPDDANWIKRISGVNGVDLRSLFPGVAGLAEDFAFSSIEVKEQIPALIDVASEFQNTNSDGDLISFEVLVGDMFIAKKGDDFYIFQVKEVNETAADNADNYVVDIKF